MSTAVTIRLINRMLERGAISKDAHARLLDSPLPEDPHQQIGMLQALLTVALWPDDEEEEHAK
ncbi:MAG: hypothetical protein AB7E70_19540 [Hyphomicrobiaceae bacterium]